MIFPDWVRVPPPADPTQDSYKDWLHLNIVDPRAGWLAVLTASLQGSPRDTRSLALGVALVHQADRGWTGNVEVLEQSAARIEPGLIALSRMAVAVAPSPATLVVSVAELDQVSAKVEASPTSQPIFIELPLPFGRGWISWNVAPQLRPRGTLSVGGTTLPLVQATAYHDHNWGRWYWGDDIGWEWGYFQGRTLGVVVARTTNRAHSITGNLWCSIHAGGNSRGFLAASLKFDGQWQGRLRRLPGSMAALYQDRARPLLPARVMVTAADPPRHVSLRFETRAAAQLIAVDPASGGSSFIHELVGPFVCEGHTGMEPFVEEGWAVFEYVD